MRNKLTALVREPPPRPAGAPANDVLRRRSTSSEGVFHEWSAFVRCLLQKLSADVCCLPGSAELGDSLFCGDAAIMLPSNGSGALPAAALSLMKEPHRAGEPAEIELHLQRHSREVTIHRLENKTGRGVIEGSAAGTCGNWLVVGIGCRANSDGADALEPVAAASGYRMLRAELHGCEFLDDAAALFYPDGKAAVLLDETRIDPLPFRQAGFDCLSAAEPYATKLFSSGRIAVVPEGLVRTSQLLAERLGMIVHRIPFSNLLGCGASPAALCLAFERPAPANGGHIL